MTPSTLLLTTLISITFYISHSEVKNCQGDCACDADRTSQTCTLNCATADSCKKSTLTCGAGRPCNVYCTKASSCADFTHINAGLATDVLVVCDADDACKAHSTIICGTGDCHLVCGTPTACEEIGIVDTSKAASFTCNDCPIGTANLQFTANPTKQPTQAPSAGTASPSTPPTSTPTKTPSTNPSSTPTKTPTYNPTETPTKIPTTSPTKVPSKTPSQTPTAYPTDAPTSQPTITPTSNPTTRPTDTPSARPTATPTAAPTTDEPTMSPSKHPSNYPTVHPTSGHPTTATPTTANPTHSPTTEAPTTDSPTTSNPTQHPIPDPTRDPTPVPSQSPTQYPTDGPTDNPSVGTTEVGIVAMETTDGGGGVNQVYSKTSDDNSNTLLIPMISMALSVVIIGVIIGVCWRRKRGNGMVMVKSDDDGEQIEIVRGGNTKSGLGANDYLVRVHYNKKQLDFTLNGSESGRTNDCGWDENTFEELNNAIKKTFNISHDQFGLHEIVDDCFVNIDEMDDIAASFVDTKSKTIDLVIQCGNDNNDFVGRKTNLLSDTIAEESGSRSMSLI